MMSNVSTPLIGVVDTGIVGQLPDPAYIGAVAVGSLVFSFVFWGFGFLRMGTTGLAAQAIGAEDTEEAVSVLGRAILIALGAGAGLILLQWPIREAAFFLLQGPVAVEQLAENYFTIRIWAAPATLANYALLGWFIGLGRTRTGLLLQLILNIGNMGLDAILVLGFGWGVEGVALGTLLAEVIAAAAGLFIAHRYVGPTNAPWQLKRLLIRERLHRTLAVGGNIMIRSLALVFVFAWFMAKGAEQGAVILAANAILMHFIAIGAYFLDGLAFSAEALVGRAVGAADRSRVRAAVHVTTLWAAGVAVGLSIVLAVFGTSSIDILTIDPGARLTARTYLPWAVFAPMLGVWAFQLDGIFIGATRTADMRNAMLMSLGIFLASWWLLTSWENHGLWAALYVHYVARIGTLAYYYPRLLRSVIESPATLFQRRTL